MNRSDDWWQQSQRDLEHARRSAGAGDFEWAAFAAQQAAEKALKALILARGGEPWGHLITSLVESLPEDLQAPEELVETANRLDKHDIPARYPQGFPEGYPGKLYSRGEAQGAVSDAESLIAFCGSHLSQ